MCFFISYDILISRAFSGAAAVQYFAAAWYIDTIDLSEIIQFNNHSLNNQMKYQLVDATNSVADHTSKQLKNQPTTHQSIRSDHSVTISCHSRQMQSTGGWFQRVDDSTTCSSGRLIACLIVSH